jgi:hypothetical protein
MKSSLRKMSVCAAIVLSLTLVLAMHAQANTEVTGVVYSVSVADSIIQIDEGGGTITTVYCIPFTKLTNKYHVVLNVGDEVSIDAYDRTFSDGTTKLVAVSLTAENESGQTVTVQLR